jgi:hypothetical protein
MKPFGIRDLALCCIALVASACGEHIAVNATNGKLAAACNWNGECLPEFRFFTYKGPEVELRLVFGSGVDSADSVRSIRANLQAADADIKPGLIPTDGHEVCGYTRPIPILTDYQRGILSGRLHGGIRLCRLLGDVTDDTGIDPVSFTVAFDLAFDPHEMPPPSTKP